MHEMPVIGESIFARVLAHGRNDDSVAKANVTKDERFEKAHTNNIDDRNVRDYSAE